MESSGIDNQPAQSVDLPARRPRHPPSCYRRDVPVHALAAT